MPIIQCPKCGNIGNWKIDVLDLDDDRNKIIITCDCGYSMSYVVVGEKVARK